MVIIIVRFARAAVFMKFRGSRENIFSHSCLHATWRRRSVCPLLSDRETNRDSFISVSLSFFFLLSCFVYSVLCLSIQSGIFGVLSNKQEEERLRWIFRGGGNLTVNQGWLFRGFFYTGFFSFHFSKRSVHPAWDVVFVCIYTYMFRFVFSLIEQAFLASIVYCISMDISEVVYKWRESFLIEKMVDNRKYTLIL